VIREALHVAVQVDDFLSSSSSSLREGVRVSRDLLRVLVYAALECERAYERWRARVTPKYTLKEAARRSVAAQARAKASFAQLSAALRDVLNGCATELARVATAARLVGADGRHGTALAALVTIARETLAGDDATVVARCRLYNVTEAWVARCADAADEARCDDRGELSPTDTKAARKAVLDSWSGATFVLLERIALAFERARTLDGRVPKLRLGGLRSALLRTITPPAPAKPPRRRRTRRRRHW
jgi:hypothetical protein